MMILRSSPSSPFGRKVRIAASVLGLDGDITIEPADTTQSGRHRPPAKPARQDSGARPRRRHVLFDSRVILDYLDHRAGGGKIVPNDAAARFAALRLQALADGIMDASILAVYEIRWRPAEKHEQKWLDHQAGKVDAGARRARGCTAGARIAAERRSDRARLRARLSRLSFPAARGGRIIPRLAAWLDDFAAQVPAFDATKPPG